MSTQRIRNDEALLSDYARRLARHTEGRRAVHVHLSELRPHNRRDHHMRIAQNCFDPLIKKFNGEIFLVSNDDIVFVCKDASIGEIDDVVLKLRFLFNDDPFVRADESEQTSPFCTWYDLEAGYEEFLAMARRLEAACRIQGDPRASVDARARDSDKPKPSQPIDPEKLGRLEQALGTMDLGSFLRWQPICVLTPGRQPKPVFREVFISITELQRAVMPDVDLRADRWLFQRLTSVIDRRLLPLVAALESRASIPTCLYTSLGTLLSPEFLAFDANIRDKLKKTFILELQNIDVFGDMALYLFARDFVRERNYRICLDGLTGHTFPLIDRRDLGLDLLKIQWTPEMVDEIHEERGQKLREAVALAGPSRVILCHCDDAAAIDEGHSLGISMFQGSHVDALLRQGTVKAVA